VLSPWKAEVVMIAFEDLIRYSTYKFSTQQQHLKASHWILVVISISYFFFSLVTAHEFLTLPRLSIYPDESTQHSATIHLSSLFTTLWGHKNEVYMFTAGSKAEDDRTELASPTPMLIWTWHHSYLVA
jgi:hypothetical protein